MHRFRFGVVVGQASDGRAWVEQARRIEGMGFSTLLVPDGLQRTLAPFPALAVAAAATSALRVGPYVVANDLRHPVMLAKEAASLDLLSGGRLELGMGAGRPSGEADMAMLGRPLDPGPTRVARLAESLDIVKRLLAGETVSREGAFYEVRDAQVSVGPAQHPVPILIGASRSRLLALAAREADVIALGIGPDASAADVAGIVVSTHSVRPPKKPVRSPA